MKEVYGMDSLNQAMILKVIPMNIRFNESLEDRVKMTKSVCQRRKKFAKDQNT
jgi:hypothetical protein